MSYAGHMTITYKTVIGEDGEPEAAVIPWSLFEEIRERLAEQGAADFDRTPNATTVAAMEEPTDNLPRFASVGELLADLRSGDDD